MLSGKEEYMWFSSDPGLHAINNNEDIIKKSIGSRKHLFFMILSPIRLLMIHC